MRLNRVLFFLLFTISGLRLSGQSIHRELIFAKHLIVKKNYEEAIYVLEHLRLEQQISPIQKDSIHFFLGNIYYSQKDLLNSNKHFNLVTDCSPRLKSEAVFFSSFNSAYLKKYSEAKNKLMEFQITDSTEQQLRNLELSGVFLLQRDLKKYDSIAYTFTPPNYAIDEHEKKMKEHYEKIIHKPKKSPFVAAALSAILPGAGKFYAGNKGQAIYTLMISTVLGLQAWEGYHKDGSSSFRFIAYSTIFCSLYIGTIWGSAFTVKFKRDQLNETLNDQILFAMHIPLRTIFH